MRRVSEVQRCTSLQGEELKIRQLLLPSGFYRIDTPVKTPNGDLSRPWRRDRRRTTCACSIRLVTDDRLLIRQLFQVNESGDFSSSLIPSGALDTSSARRRRHHTTKTNAPVDDQRTPLDQIFEFQSIFLSFTPSEDLLGVSACAVASRSFPPFARFCLRNKQEVKFSVKIARVALNFNIFCTCR